ncbi:MAG: LuxR C-terminal-related transcriptional regulator [Candidatus Obscuribacterales bacterium]|jgi:DNA-binding CsgD family transcriptional regulator
MLTGNQHAKLVKTVFPPIKNRYVNAGLFKAMSGSEKISTEHLHEIHLSPVVKLLQHLSESSVRHGASGAKKTDFAAEIGAICEALELNICALFQVTADPYFDGLKLNRLSLVSGDDSASAKLNAVIPKGLEIADRSELHSLLRQEQWVPLGEACLGNETPQALRALAEYCGATNDSAAVLFPVVLANQMIGVLLMERALSAGGFSEELLDLGQVIARMLAVHLGHCLEFDESLVPQAALLPATESTLPTVLLKRQSLVVESANTTARSLFASGGKNLVGQPLLKVFPGSKNFLDALQQSLTRADGSSCFSVSASDLRQIGCAAALVSLTGDGDSLVRLQFIPRDFLASGDAKEKSSAGKPNERTDSSASDDLDEATKRMGVERWLRQTVCKLHSSLDRDHLLQTLADSLGRIFRATRCLVIRTDGPSHPMVTHEYVEPDLSPLGLGRTGQFPMFALSLFQQKTFAVSEVTKLPASGQLSERDVDLLLESGIRSMAGAPLSHQGTQYGVVILVVGDHGRTWSEADLETIELTAAQASIALSHCQTYHQVKDQLFHMNLLGNLTQQLTNALEVAAKAPSPKILTRAEERASLDESPPLSSREMEVLKLIASGFANKEIAQRLFLTESTVELHASRIRKKLNLKSRTALVKYACDNDLV